MNTRLITKTLAAALILAASSANGATIANPTLASGAGNVIDPTGGEGVDQSFGTVQSTLEARSDLRVLQDFTSFAAGGNNIVSFTDGSLPDIQFQFSGLFSATSAGNASTNVAGATSAGGSVMSQRNSATGTSTLTISFGTWDGSAFSANQTVGAAAFTFNNVYTTKTGSVLFKDAGGTSLNTSFAYTGANDTDSSGNHKDFYFGWDATAETTSQIASIEITFTDSGGPFTSFIDDVAFTTIPEPSAALLGSLGILGLLLRRRRA